MARDIDNIVEQIKRRFPTADVWQLWVSHPGVDDDGIWYFTTLAPEVSRRHRRAIQIESSNGSCPFIVENDDMKSSSEAETAHSVDEAVEKITAYLDRLQQSPNGDGGKCESPS
jgi:hypothetical protein